MELTFSRVCQEPEETKTQVSFLQNPHQALEAPNICVWFYSEVHIHLTDMENRTPVLTIRGC